jgi:hypothetical protein
LEQTDNNENLLNNEPDTYQSDDRESYDNDEDIPDYVVPPKTEDTSSVNICEDQSDKLPKVRTQQIDPKGDQSERHKEPSSNKDDD